VSSNRAGAGSSVRRHTRPPTGSPGPHPALRPEAQRYHGPDGPACPVRRRPHSPAPGQPPDRLARPAGRPARRLFSLAFPGTQAGKRADRGRARPSGFTPSGSARGRGRATALFTLAADVPAAILAKTLGIHIQAATQWQKISAGDWAAYAADVSRRSGHTRRSHTSTPCSPPDVP